MASGGQAWQGVRQSILWSVWMTAARQLRQMDDATVTRANTLARGARLSHAVTTLLAGRLAAVEVALMGLLLLTGGRRSVVRMLLAVAGIYAASELAGAAWRRQRPFAVLPDVVALVDHAAGRSFPSRHTASAVAMAIIGGRVHPQLGRAMLMVGGVLSLSRVAAGVHYPSDVVGGAALGAAIGRVMR